MEVMWVMEVMKARAESPTSRITSIAETRATFGREVVLDCGVVGGRGAWVIPTFITFITSITSITCDWSLS
jgi:hypothetical protein